MTPLPQAIIFDLDDTILSVNAKPREAWVRAAEASADALCPFLPKWVAAAIEARSREFWSDPAWNRAWRGHLLRARRIIVAAAFADLAAGGRPAPPAEIGEAIADCFTASREADQRLFPGALETLARLRQEGVRLALLTNGAREPQRAKITRFGLEAYFDAVLIEGELGFGKPEERAYANALATLESPARESWIVGDNLEWEVKAPQNCGIYAIWCDSYGTGLPPGSTIVPDRIIKSLAELLPS